MSTINRTPSIEIFVPIRFSRGLDQSVPADSQQSISTIDLDRILTVLKRRAGAQALPPDPASFDLTNSKVRRT
ncbi:hypothetical protein [Ensifer sp. MJa1]|uniref:hypothetical protein n=1 Tax=Ensifer sp. MJa1 TaxID=2919888 RepID=UPI00300933D7